MLDLGDVVLPACVTSAVRVVPVVLTRAMPVAPTTLAHGSFAPARVGARVGIVASVRAAVIGEAPASCTGPRETEQALVQKEACTVQLAAFEIGGCSSPCPLLSRSNPPQLLDASTNSEPWLISTITMMNWVACSMMSPIVATVSCSLHRLP